MYRVAVKARLRKKYIDLKRFFFDPSHAQITEIYPESISSILDESLHETINAHLISDVPVGIFLSAGLDSSIIMKYVKIFSPIIRI